VHSVKSFNSVRLVSREEKRMQNLVGKWKEEIRDKE